jgi:DNA-binding Lrp family transcriptional regulator
VVKLDSDETAKKILHALSVRSRSSIQGVAKDINLSPRWLKKQIVRMREQGIIKSWQLVLNPRILQQQIFFFLLKTNPNEPRVVEELLTHYDETFLSSIEGITGEYSLIGRFHFPNATDFLDSLDHLYELIGGTGFQKYQIIEVIKVHKEHGISVPEEKHSLKSHELDRLQMINKLGEKFDLPPSTYEIAEEINVSQPTVYRQLKKWRDRKIILAYSVNTSYWSDNFLHSYIQIKAPLGKYKSAIEFCLDDGRVIEIYRTNQEYSLLLKTRHPALDDLSQFLKSLYKHTTIADTVTRIVLDYIRS